MLAQSGASRLEDLHSKRDKDLAVQGGLEEAIVLHQQFLHIVIFIRVIQSCDERQMLNNNFENRKNNKYNWVNNWAVKLKVRVRVTTMGDNSIPDITTRADTLQ